MSEGLTQALKELACHYNVQTTYHDIAGARREASPEALMAVLRALGAPIQRADDAPAAARERLKALWERVVEPVSVAWNGAAAVELRLPSDDADRAAACQLVLETGDAQAWKVELTALPVTRAAEVDGRRFVVKTLQLPPLAQGYHRLLIETGGRSYESLVISAPERAYPSEGGDRRLWGAFLPLYSLHSGRSWGAGDFTDLERLIEWVAGQGGSVVATLPMLASFLDEPFAPSPYVPVSRLFWNEFYLDISRAPQAERCGASTFNSKEGSGEIEALRSARQVDYRRQMALKRRALEAMATGFFDEHGEGDDRFRRFLEASPQARDYARFRATVERQRKSWWTWPDRMRGGKLEPGDYDDAAMRYHLFAQWVASEQIAQLSEKARKAGQGLYLDLPLGVHPDGYDTWRERDAFTLGVSGGSPPDPFFSKGQDWGFPPLHPERVREQGYRYPIAYIRHQMRSAGVLRIDHVMGLHRLFMVPWGMKATEGVYASYKAEEFYAILSLESHRHRCWVVGENLGTVPPYVNPAMQRHNARGMYVLQFEVRPDPNWAINPPPAGAVASLNTHDLPPFASYWKGADIDDRVALGLLGQDAGAWERQERQRLTGALLAFLRQKGYADSAGPDDALSALKGCLAFLGEGEAGLVLANLEDLWLDPQPQNVPGTVDERPNWRKKAARAFEEFTQMPEVLDTLSALDRRRRRQR